MGQAKKKQQSFKCW